MTDLTQPLDRSPDWDGDHFHEECGVFGVFGAPDAAALTALGLHSLQHRGQEACGIVSWDGVHFHAHRRMAMLVKTLTSRQRPSGSSGHAAIGHNRYATTGGANLRNVQPLFADFEFGGMALCHNGNLTNAIDLRDSLVRQGCLFQSTSDTETIIHLVARSPQHTVLDRVVDAMKKIVGAYSLACLSGDSLIGIRDPHGVRPLVLGKLGDAHILASETCALDIIGADFVRDIEPGEVVHISAQGVQSLKPFANTPRRFCIFEYV